MADRYFVESPIAGDQAVLAGPEAHHLAHVMRARAGDLVTLFDGSGAEFAARVERIGRSDITLAVLSRELVDREHPRPITLAVALPKGDRQKWLVEKAVELGVARLVPIETRRGVPQPAAAIERLRRAVIEASKQCGRNRLMQIAAARPWDAYLAEVSSDAPRLVAHPGGAPAVETIAACLGSLGIATPAFLAVGPEGGFTDEETRAARAAGWRLVGLGNRILRVETAALALVSLVAAQHGGG
jgi:16S rRNA (uracil1498-N3)-methyltransferase